jgi:hypothetical protein
VKKVLLSHLEEHPAANKEDLRTHLAYFFQNCVFIYTGKDNQSILLELEGPYNIPNSYI